MVASKTNVDSRLLWTLDLHRHISLSQRDWKDTRRG